MSRLWQDLRFGARMLCRRPGTTFVLVLTLALGIGANSAIFSVVDAVLLRPLPYADSEQLVNLYEHNHARGFSRFSISIHNLCDWRSQSQAFEEMAAYNYQAANLTGGSEPRWVTFASVSANLFRLLEVTPVLGRAFLPDEMPRSSTSRSGSMEPAIPSSGSCPRRSAFPPPMSSCGGRRLETLPSIPAIAAGTLRAPSGA